MRRFLSIVSLCVITHLHSQTTTSVFLGNQTKGDGGIYHAFLNNQTGELTPPQLLADVWSVEFFIRHPRLNLIYALTSQRRDGFVQAYHYSQDGRIREFGTVGNPNGRSAHGAVHPSGRFLLTVQYRTGKITVFPLDNDGRILEHTQVITHTGASDPDSKRQSSPHPHWAGFSPCGHFAAIPDLGTDTIEIYRVDAESRQLTHVSSAQATQGSGPRHMRFSADGTLIYLLSEIAPTVQIFTFDAETGSTESLGSTSTLTPEELSESEVISSSEIEIHPSGDFLYTTNRSHNSISVFKIGSEGVTLERVQLEPSRSEWARHIDITQDGKWLLVGGQRSNNISVFGIDSTTGKIRYREGSTHELAGASCFIFVELGFNSSAPTP